METSIFDFWSRWFGTLAQGRRQMEERAQWCTGGGSGYEYVSSFFKSFSRPDQTTDAFGACFTFWRQYTEVMQSTLKESLALFDVVTREDYDTLTARCAELEKTIKEKDETIARLQGLLGDDTTQPAAMAERFQQLLLKQQEDFQGLMTSLSSLFMEKNEDKPAPRKRR
ncbi:MAG: hypothetical protein N2Z74_08065 [Syntrophales bacterium]|nr:hypothetical protein [Syntrophales bacterium]